MGAPGATEKIQGCGVVDGGGGGFVKKQGLHCIVVYYLALKRKEKERLKETGVTLAQQIHSNLDNSCSLQPCTN